MHSKFLRILRSLGVSPAAALSTHLQAGTLSLLCCRAAFGQAEGRLHAAQAQQSEGCRCRHACCTAKQHEVGMGRALCAAQGHNLQYQSKSVCTRTHAG